MNKFEFIKYEPTPAEKHMGVATVNLYGKIILRYKIVQTKDGQGFFPCPASLKIGDGYVNCFSLDSQTEKEEIETFIKNNVRSILSGNNVPLPMQQSAEQKQYSQSSFLGGCPF